MNLFVANGYTDVGFGEPADVIVVNTCTVTGVSDKKSRQLIRRAAGTYPNAVIIAAGCYAQAFPDLTAKLPGVDIVVGTGGRGGIVGLAEQYINEKIQINAVTDVSGRETYENLSVTGFKNRTRAFLKIGDGCDNRCAYCVVPRVRGPAVSRALYDIEREARFFAREGFKEIVVTGIEIASYGNDLNGPGLLDVVKTVASIDGIERIRFGSLPPGAFTDAFVRGLKQWPKVCDHFHISLQSGCDATLKRMNRGYTADDYKRAVSRVYGAFPDAGVAADVIAGFPGETDNEFEDSLKFCEGIPFIKLHAFPYSPRAGTPAASFNGQISEDAKKARVKQYIGLSETKALTFKKRFMGKTMPVLFEGRTKTPGAYEGYTTNYIKIKHKSETDISGQIIDVTIK